MQKNKLYRNNNSIIRVLEIKNNAVLVIECISKTMPQAYLEYYEYCSKNNIQLHEHDTKYLSNLYNLKYFRKDQVTEKDRNRAYAILCA